MIHALITAVTQIAVGLLTDNWLVGGIVMVFFYAGREHAQAEYRYIESFCERKRVRMPWYGGFDKDVWDLKSAGDIALPIMVFIVIFVSR